MKVSLFIRRFLFVVSFLILINGCSQPIQQGDVYDHDSWKSIIPNSCLVFYDGCNNCRRNAESDVAACTRKACVLYEKPVCRDKVN